MRTSEHHPHEVVRRRRRRTTPATSATSATPVAPSVLRPTASSAACGAVTALLASAARATVPDALGGELDTAVGAAVLGLGCLAGVALTLGSLLLLASAALHRAGLALHLLDAIAARVTPAALRRVVAVGVGAGIGLGVVAPAGATEVDLGWEITAESAVDTPDLSPPPLTTTGTTTVSTTSGTTASDEPAPTVSHVVRAGDSLWTIAEAHLPAGSTVGDVAAAWPAWHRANRDLIGPDPDLIRPGQVLVAPATLEETP